MTDPRETLARIRAHADAATEGPWRATPPESPYCHVFTEDESFVEEYGPELHDAKGFFSYPDAEFIAAARTTVPLLADALEQVLNLHVKAQPIPAAYGTQEGGDYCVTCAEDWPCATVTTITTALEGETDA